MEGNFNFKIVFRFRCDSDVVHCVETNEMSLPHKDYYFEHKATVMAMNILLGMADDLKLGNKKLEDFKIVWRV